jgi:GNAT superfamily N-acetyltransferase
MISIRRAEPEDCSAIMDVHSSAVRAIPNGYYAPEEIQALAIPRTAEAYKQSIGEKDFYVALDGEILGYGILNREKHEIEALFVSAEAKGKGVGSKLLKQLEEIARSLGLEMLSLNSSMNAVAFYQRAGFVAHEESKYRLHSGTEIRCVPMTKVLADR